MKCGNKLKEIDIESHACCDFDVINNIIDFDLDDISLNGKSFGKFCICIVKPTCIILDKLDGYIKKYDSTKYLTLFHSYLNYERIFDRI